jgi:hypothetical protein
MSLRSRAQDIPFPCKNQLKRLARSNLVDLLDSWSVVAASRSATGESTRSTSWHATGHTSSTALLATVEAHHDRVGDGLELLLVLLVLLLGGLLALVQPGDGLVDLALEGLLISSLKLLIDLGVGESVAQRVRVRLETVLGADAASLSLILGLVLLGLSQHALNLLLGQAALVVGDDNLVGLASALLESGDVHDSVGIEIEGDLNLGDTARSRWDAGKLELTQQVVVLGALTLTLEDLDKHTRLVVGEGREDLGLLGGDGGVAGNELGHLATSSLDTERQRSDIEQEDLVGGLGRSVARQDSSLDGSTVGNSLIGVDGLVGLLSVEVVGNELLDAGDTGGTSDQDDLVDLGLVNLGISQDTVDGGEGRAEEVLAQLFETSTGDGGVEVDTLEQRVDLNRGLGGGGEGSLSTLAGGAETTQSTCVGAEICEIVSINILDTRK